MDRTGSGTNSAVTSSARLLPELLLRRHERQPRRRVEPLEHVAMSYPENMRDKRVL